MRICEALLDYRDTKIKKGNLESLAGQRSQTTRIEDTNKLFQVLSEDRFFLLSLAPLPTPDIKDTSTFVSEYQQILHNTYRYYVDRNRLSDSVILVPFEGGRPRWKHAGNKQGLRLVMNTYACTEHFCSHE